LGEWLEERRDLYADYIKYIEQGREDDRKMPRQVVRVWFIAGNRWQRYEGEMFVRDLKIEQGERALEIL
jgi:hypothetical protein